MIIVVDAGPLIAAAVRTDPDHDRCRAWLAGAEGPLVVPIPVLTETCYFVEQDDGPELEAEFLDSFGPRGRFELEDLRGDDVAERLEVSEIASLDLRVALAWAGVTI